MNTTDVAIIVGGVVDLAALGTGLLLGMRIADRLRVVNPVKPVQPTAPEAQAAPVEDLNARRVVNG